MSLKSKVSSNSHKTKDSSISNNVTAKKTTKSSKVLTDVNCFVEAVNNDGIDASSSYVAILQSLGASISDSFGDQLTHYICTNGNVRRIKAAQALGIFVVSPLWVEQCNDSKQKVPEIDFLVPISDQELSSTLQSKSVVKEPRPGDAQTRRNLDSPFFSSSQRDELPPRDTRASKLDKLNQNKFKTSETRSFETRIVKPSPGETSVISTDEDEPSKKSYRRITKSTASDHIPLPSFRPFVAPVPRINGNKLRRSERIMDNYDPDDEEYDEVHEADLNSIDPETPLLIVADDLPKEPEKANKAVLKANGKSKSDGKADKSLHEGTSQSLKSSRTNNSSVVVAITGFDDTNGEKTTLTALLTAVMKIIRDKQIPTQSSSSLSSRGSAEKIGDRFLKNDEDPFCETCTHVIAFENCRRTQRILFAMARNIPIVTIQWIYACLEAESWVSVDPYLHTFDRSNNKSLRTLFQRETVLVGASSDLPPSTLSNLLHLTGAKITEELSRASMLLFGDSADALAWFDSLNDTIKKSAAIDKKKALKLSEDGKVFSSKYAFDCLLHEKKLSKDDCTDDSVGEELFLTFQQKKKKSDSLTEVMPEKRGTKRKGSPDKMIEGSSKKKKHDSKEYRSSGPDEVNDAGQDRLRSTQTKIVKIAKQMPSGSKANKSKLEEEWLDEDVGIAIGSNRRSPRLSRTAKHESLNGKESNSSSTVVLSQNTAASTLLNLSKSPLLPCESSVGLMKSSSTKPFGKGRRVSISSESSAFDTLSSPKPGLRAIDVNSGSKDNSRKPSGRLLSLATKKKDDDEEMLDFDEGRMSSQSPVGRVGRAQSPSW